MKKEWCEVYKKQKSQGLRSFSVLIPEEGYERLKKEAMERGLCVANYARGLLLGNEYINLRYYLADKRKNQNNA